jgi:hypothetical protein
LCTTNPTWPDPGSNPGRRGGKSANNRLSYGTDCKDSFFVREVFVSSFGWDRLCWDIVVFFCFSRQIPKLLPTTSVSFHYSLSSNHFDAISFGQYND